jgi:DNA-binding MarR family transcriptional regulator
LPDSHAHTTAEDDDRSYLAYRYLSQVFIELDDSDRRFLRALSQALWPDDGHYVLSITHFWALVHLGVPDGRTMAELADLLLCDRSNVTAVVDKFEERGWAERLRGKAGDRRYLRVILTPAGWTVRRQVMVAHREWVQRRLAILPFEQLDQLIALLKAMQGTTALDPDQIVAELIGTLAEVGAADGGPPVDAAVRS